MTTTSCTAHADAPTNASPDAWGEADSVLAQIAALPTSHPDRIRLREQVICRCAPEARREAGRYRNTGQPLDDLLQVATLGLILAVDRFDPSRGIPFKYFALPTITGELKRHLRDKGWAIKVSRRMQELHQEVRRAEPLLAQQLGHMPTSHDLAEHLGLSEEDIGVARHGAAAFVAHSLNYPTFGEDDGGELGDSLGSPDHALELLPDHDALVRAWPLLPERVRAILTMRFVDELTQSQIADKFGISQMHVSRLITRGLARLRRHMTAENPGLV